MRHFRTILVLSIILFSGAAFICLEHFTTTPIVFQVPQGWPKPVYDFKNNPLTKEGFELGKKLFYDVNLSKDSTIACASCHQQFGAFSTYEHNLSHGYNNSFTTRNAPALQNLAWQKEFMHDGGIPHLDLQPLAPMAAPNEMGETIEHIITKVKADAAYRKMFKAAFGNELVNTQRMNKALSQFMLMLVSSNSKYDKVMRGEATFILPEQLGYDIFKKKCVSCHTEPLFTDYSYRNIGMPLDSMLNDFGRMKITGDSKDSLKFRVPSLRNVAVTYPYGHDGRFFSLYNVFEHYRNKMIVGPTTDTLLKHKLYVSNYEVGQLKAFLYTLTDTTFLRNKMFSPEGYTITPPFIHTH
jgi:cytochrome c peroxidase